MWGREGREEEEKVQSISISTPSPTRDSCIFISGGLHTFLVDFFLIGWKDFSFLEYRQILGRAWIEEIQKRRRGRGESFNLPG